MWHGNDSDRSTWMVFYNDVANNDNYRNVDEASYKVPVEEVKALSRTTDGSIEGVLLCETISAHDQVVERSTTEDGRRNGNDSTEVQASAILQREEEDDRHDAGEDYQYSPIDGDG